MDKTFAVRSICLYKNLETGSRNNFVHEWIAQVLSSWSIARHRWFGTKSFCGDSEKFSEPLQIFARVIVLIQQRALISYMKSRKNFYKFRLIFESITHRNNDFPWRFDGVINTWIYILFSISIIYDIIYQVIFILIFTNTIREKMNFHSFIFIHFYQKIYFLYMKL